jgi:hypothetical protein
MDSQVSESFNAVFLLIFWFVWVVGFLCRLGRPGWGNIDAHLVILILWALEAMHRTTPPAVA